MGSTTTWSQVMSESMDAFQFHATFPHLSRRFITLHLQISASLRHPHNPVVFFDVVVGSTPLGRILVELFAGPIDSEA